MIKAGITQTLSTTGVAETGVTSELNGVNRKYTTPTLVTELDVTVVE